MPTVQYMSKEAAHELSSPAFVLRIRMPAQNYQDLPMKHLEVLTVQVYPDSVIPAEICEQIIAFAERAEAANADIVVHCNEGRYRSRAVANFIWRFFDEYDHTGKDWVGGEMRDQNYKSLYNHHKATRTEKQA